MGGHFYLKKDERDPCFRGDRQKGQSQLHAVSQDLLSECKPAAPPGSLGSTGHQVPQLGREMARENHQVEPAEPSLGPLGATQGQKTHLRVKKQDRVR